MAQSIIPLKQLDVKQHLGVIMGLMGAAKGYAKMGAPKVPGVPDVKETVKKMLEKEAKKYLQKARVEIMVLLIGIMTGALLTQIPKINGIIRTLNNIINGINSILKKLVPIVKALFPVIIVITVVYIVSKIVSLLPVPGAGMGAVISFASFISAATMIMNACSAMLEVLWPIAFAIIAVMLMLLALFGFLNMAMGLMGAFSQQQDDLKSEAKDAMNATAEDNANAGAGDGLGVGGKGGGALSAVSGAGGDGMGGYGYAGGGAGVIGGGLGGDGLNADGTGEGLGGDGAGGDGAGGAGGVCAAGEECANLSYEECLNSSNCFWDSSGVGTGGVGTGGVGTGGGAHGGSGVGDGSDMIFVQCTLPSGEVRQMTPEDCMAAGGTFPGMDGLSQLNDINSQLSDINMMLSACLLPDGTIIQMTPEDCAAAGGCFGCAIDPNLCWSECQHGLDMDGSKIITCQLPDGAVKDITLSECTDANGMDLSVANLMGLLGDLKAQQSDLNNELGDLVNYSIGENVITSLLNPDKSVTIEKATRDSGQRIGFYQSDIKT